MPDDVSVVKTPDVDEAMFKELLTGKRELSDKQIADLLKRVKPVVRRNGSLYYIKPVDPRGVSFIWDPKTTKKATDLSEVGKINTLHTWGYYGLFKPSLAEVLEMIPEDQIENCKAFETIGPDDVHDLNRQWAAVDGGYHVAVTILYT